MSGQTRRRLAATTIFLLALLALATAGCGARYARERIYDANGYTVTLRSRMQGGEPVERGFSHPASISGVRLAHVLAAVDVRIGEGEKSERRAAVPTGMLFEVGELMSKAFGKATSSQEVVVQAVRKQRRLGVFSDDYLTSFTSWVQGDSLHIAFSRTDSRLPLKGPEDADLPEPWPGQEVMDFRVLPTEHVVPTGPQSVAVDWRSPSFRKPKHVTVGTRGELHRRTILMESPSEADAAAEEAAPAGLSPETLRELADLEEARRSGAITEGDYHARRRVLLGKTEGDSAEP